MSTPEDIQQLRTTNQQLENRVLELTKLVIQLQSKLKTAHLVLNWPLDTTLANLKFNLDNPSPSSSNHHGVTSIDCLTRMTSVSVKDRTQIFSQNEKPIFPTSPGIHRPLISTSPLKGFKRGETLITRKENMLQTTDSKEKSPSEKLYPAFSVQNLASPESNNANFRSKLNHKQFKSTNSLSKITKSDSNEILQHSIKEGNTNYDLSVEMKISSFVDFAAVPQNEQYNKDGLSSPGIKIPTLNEGMTEEANYADFKSLRSGTKIVTIDSDHVKISDLRVNIPNSTYKTESRTTSAAETLNALKTVDSTARVTETESNDLIKNNDTNVKINEIANGENKLTTIITNKLELQKNEELNDVCKDMLNIPGIDAQNKVENNDNKNHRMSVREEPKSAKDSDNLNISTDKLSDSNNIKRPDLQAEQTKNAKRENRLSYLGMKFGGLSGKRNSALEENFVNGAKEEPLVVNSLTDLSVSDEITTKRNSRKVQRLNGGILRLSSHNGESAKAVGTSKNDTNRISLQSLQHFIASIKRTECRSLTEPSGGRDVTYIIFALNDKMSLTEVRFIEKTFFDFYALMQKVDYFLNYIRYVKIPSLLVFLSHPMKVNLTPAQKIKKIGNSSKTI